MYISILLLCCLNAGTHWHTGFLVDKNIIFQIIILSSVAADCAFEVIFGIIYSCKREHLSGVVIWTLQASCLKPQTFRTHFRSVDSEKNMSKRQQSLTRKPRSGRTEAFALLFFLFCFFNSALSAHAGRGLKENRAPGSGSVSCLRPAEACALPGSELWKPHRCLCSRKRSCSGLCKISLPCLNFYFCFSATDMARTRGCAFAQLDLWSVIVGYTLF